MTDSVQANEANGEQQPFAYTLKQAAALLNISYKTAHRLNKRGLLRSSTALRTKLISRKEIERFLKATTEGNPSLN
jgi:predicted site-specific integrase-resolvase